MNNQYILLTTEDLQYFTNLSSTKEELSYRLGVNQQCPEIEIETFVVFSRENISSVVATALEKLLKNIDKININDLEQLTKNI